MKKVLFPGQFDPFTLGHFNIFKRILNHFDFVILGIIENPNKNPWLSLEERKSIIEKNLKTTLDPDFKNYSIVTHKGLLLDLLKKLKIDLLVRGIRSFDHPFYEFKMSRIHYDLSKKKVDTFFIFSDATYDHISSSTIRELLYLNLFDELKPFIQPEILEIYRKKKKDFI